MKAPDKIYLNKYMIRPGMLYPAQYPADTPEFEYISKDALLEWAKEKYNEYKQMDEDFQGGVFIGNRHAFAEVIAKIESL